MNVMRLTVVDSRGNISFIAPCHSLKALVAGCSAQPKTLDDLLVAAEPYDARLRAYVLGGLAVFHEHNIDGHYDNIHAALVTAQPNSTPVFRVVDDITRQASLQPVKAGLVVFNLNEKRIIQVQNTYAEIKRVDRGRVRDEGLPTKQIYRYKLPSDWAIVP
ncbi:MAG: hypothetical protein M1358_05310 [Chloroflexi bacterium]|nr:hypothetical protein [Chloroflexota bacterium]